MPLRSREHHLEGRLPLVVAIVVDDNLHSPLRLPRTEHQRLIHWPVVPACPHFDARADTGFDARVDTVTSTAWAAGGDSRTVNGINQSSSSRARPPDTDSTDVPPSSLSATLTVAPPWEEDTL